MICDICRKKEYTINFNLYGVDTATDRRVINRTIYVCDECMAEIIGSIYNLIVHNNCKNLTKENPTIKPYKKDAIIPSLPWGARQTMGKITNDARIDLHDLLERGSYGNEIIKRLREWGGTYEKGK